MQPRSRLRMMCNGTPALLTACCVVALAVAEPSTQNGNTTQPTPPVDFSRDIEPIFAARCLDCHGPAKQRSGYRIDVSSVALAGGELSAPNIKPGNAAESPLVRYIEGTDPEIEMPPKGARLSQQEIALVRRWIDEGAVWPASTEPTKDAATTPSAIASPAQRTDALDWWSLRPLAQSTANSEAPASFAIDNAVRAKLAEHNLSPSPRANDRTLVRRLYFDLIGLPPTPEDIRQFEASEDPAKYANLVDQLLASPRYGERWARHWLDAVHYADTHGYDKDKQRPHAWPYRDYVIRALNEDKPYARFVEEQIAGDALFPNTRDGIEALGFIAAGPWDLIGHEEVPEEKIDGKFARHFDRDDMIGNAIGTLASTTVQCAQCHDHKFDPITQEDYYALQSVFAALDRADRAYDCDPLVATQRAELEARRDDLARTSHRLAEELAARGGEQLAHIDRAIAATERATDPQSRVQFGYHSELSPVEEPSIESRPWIAVDLGEPQIMHSVVMAGAYDDFAGIGAGFGFPRGFVIEASACGDFTDAVVVAAHDLSIYPNPGTTPQTFTAPAATTRSPGVNGVNGMNGLLARAVRITATRLAPRDGVYIFALAELEVLDEMGRNLAAGRTVTSRNSIEMEPRWSRANLVDGIYPAQESRREELAMLRAEREALVVSLLNPSDRALRARVAAATAEVHAALALLPAQDRVYAGTVHHGSGAFRGTGATGGRPRTIHVLARGQVTTPGAEVFPAAIAAWSPVLSADLGVHPDAPESARRAALARWLTDSRNPLVWRSIVNRVWQHHFGRGIVETTNDFGRMGARPTHPELLDDLAVRFRDDMRGSLKSLHRAIVLSETYQQRSDTHNDAANAIDSANTLLWRMQRRKLDAEAVRDAVLATTGRLDLAMGGPGYEDYVVERPEHSPTYRYDLADPRDPRCFRRAIYRNIVRSQMQPFMTSLDCADPSMRVDRRNETLSPSQALSYLNNGFMVVQAAELAERVSREFPHDHALQVARAFELATGRVATADERAQLKSYVDSHGLTNACRVILNLNEFSFVD